MVAYSESVVSELHSAGKPGTVSTSLPVIMISGYGAARAGARGSRIESRPLRRAPARIIGFRVGMISYRR
jgi:hypothetical protein